MGTVGGVTAEGDDALSPATTTCAAAIIKAMRFPAPAGGGVVNVTYPFVFQSTPAPRTGGRWCLALQDLIWPPQKNEAPKAARIEQPLDVLRPSSRVVVAHVAFVYVGG